MAQTIPTKPFDGQKPGTSGLRKRVKVFQQEHYTENFVQAIFDGMPAPGPKDATIVVGGDGRYYNKEVAQIIFKIAAANGIRKIIIGQDGILSTPATSHVIRKYKADGGILLTASHNPGGPNADFGIKYNVSNGGPAPEGVTNKIYEVTKTIKEYKLQELPEVDISAVGLQNFGQFYVQVIDSVKDYVLLLKEIFDFKLIKAFLAKNTAYQALFDGLHGVTGPYGKTIFVDELGLPPASVQNVIPLPDFGGGHPDPNLTYAKSLVDVVEERNVAFGAASDGDGDRNMIYGKGAFVTPSDSVAVIADHAEVIPYFKKNGVHGLARSMPTSGALDRVAKAKGLEFFEVPTGWKFFGNLMDAGRLSICGEESFGTGSDHIREKDGIWAVVAWLNIIAAANEKSDKLIGINELLQDHYSKYGRTFFTRYDYEEVESDGAGKMMSRLTDLISTKKDSFVGSKVGEFEVVNGGDFEYTDPIDKSVSSHQGIYVNLKSPTSGDGRVVFRLSGTGSQGATVRVYIERHTTDTSSYKDETQQALKGLVDAALELSLLTEFTGRKEPTVIT